MKVQPNASSEFYFFLSGLLRPIIAEELDRKFKELQAQIPTVPDQEHFSVEQAASRLGISKQTVYQNIDKIPHSKRFGKLYFSKADLDAYLQEGKVR